jgi:hypothetical protein
MVRFVVARLVARITLGAALTCMGVAFAAQGDARFTPVDSSSFVRKMFAIERMGAEGTTSASGSGAASRARTARTGGAAPRLTAITERELNSYFRYGIGDDFPSGVTDPTISMVGNGRVTATAVVDLDAVRDAQPSSGLLTSVRLLSGRLPVTVRGVIESGRGRARFVVDSADVSGIPVPKSLLQLVVSHYSSTPSNPEGVNLDDAIDLPAGIQEIRVQPGQAIVVQ